MKAFTAVLLLNLCITLPYAFALSPTECNAVEAVAGKALDLVNKGRRDGYLFQLLRVADAHVDKGESSTVYYLVLDVIESDCSVLSRKFWDDCEPDFSRHPTHTVIGKCKVIATTRLNESQYPRVDHFNCTTSSVSSALTNTKDSPVLIDYFEDTEHYRKQAEKALEKYKEENGDFASFKVDQVERVSRVRGEERTNYYFDFSVRNCSAYHFPRHSKVFGFCKAYFSYDPQASDLENPNYINVNCEVFNIEEHRNMSGVHPLFGHHNHSWHEHSHERTPPFRPKGSRDHHSHKTHKFECPPSGEDERPPSQIGSTSPSLSSRSRCHPHHLDTDGIHGPPHNHSSSEHHPHKHHPHGHRPHGHHRHGHHPHSQEAPGQHSREHHPHGHHPHGHPPHRNHSPGHHPHRHHPPGHGFHDFGPCDPPPHRQGHHHRPHHHGPPPRNSEERDPRGPGRGKFPFPRGPFGTVHQLPPLKTGEVLPPPEANFPIFSLPHHKHSKPELQPFPQSPSESCPGKHKDDFPRVSKFF
ncbi:histidine-rich glycoprotein [Sorex fumeus]|uniref:histidine-rich glycoprotein n=1 Tax=Sorex fumeus TaxID=62283 RepID=UPI0024ACF7FC|nr:histidine-rich glycoprotein [Sorex fumeus]